MKISILAISFLPKLSMEISVRKSRKGNQVSSAGSYKNYHAAKESIAYILPLLMMSFKVNYAFACTCQMFI